MRFKVDWASLIGGRKLTVFALFYFVFEGNFQVQVPGGLTFGGVIQRRVFCVTSFFFFGGGGLYIEGLILGILRYSLLLPRYAVIMTKSSNLRGGDLELWVDFKNCAYLWKIDLFS